MKQVLTIKGKLPSYNIFYSGSHWTVRQKLAETWHEIVWAAVKKQKLKPVKDPVEIIYDIEFAKGTRDASNQAVKLLEDGLKKAGILIDDNYKYVLAYKVMIKKGREDKIKITIIKL